ncbi:PIN domain nuclease [uncultured Desulfobacter sp.]|uniref:type II toxin-antitoxin system VapC family toxin n=1 Tax=uncultured Desulfobacter sp. TaxID=240139 RepID=UPI002AA78504|nr:PIN domain nuclease [uncultured Desulfobacter sp.]
MILVDSSVWIAYFNGQINWQTNTLDTLLHEAPVLLGDLILVEILQGFKTNKEFDAARDLLAVLDCVSLNSCSLAVASAANYRTMRRQGITVRKTIDVIIGTYCIENDLPLLHDDRDFNPMETILGLQAVTP